MDRRIDDITSAAQVGQRLAWTREAKGWTQAYVAKAVGLASASGWANYESGINRIPIGYCLRFCTISGVDTNWVYQGKIDGVPHSLALKIQSLMKAS